MSNILQHPSFGQIRIRKVKNDFVYCAKDLCDVLELTHTTNALASLDQDETMTVKILHASKMREMLFVTESGLYALILRSRKPEARKFRKWITSEVLPALRKYGVYSTDQTVLDRAAKRLDEKKVQSMLDEVSNHLTYTDRRLVAKQCRTTESEINSVLNGYKEDPYLLTVLYSRATGNKILSDQLYTGEGAEKLLNALKNAK